MLSSPMILKNITYQSLELVLMVAGTGQLSKYIVATYNFRNLDFTSGIGWGKFVGESGRG